MPPDPTLNLAVLAALAVAVVAWQVVTLLAARLATAGDLLRAVQRYRTGRALLLAGWCWLGWHFFVRGSW